MEDQIVTQVKKYLNSNKKTLWTILVTAIVTMVAFYKFSSLNVAFISSPHNVKLEINDEFEQDDSLNYLDQTTFVPKKPLYIAIHCTANPPRYISRSEFFHYFLEVKKSSRVGYNYAINPDGTIITLAGINGDSVLTNEEIVNGVAGFNSRTISIAYVGGTDSKLRPKNTVTEKQMKSLKFLTTIFQLQFKGIIIKGHRDFHGVNKACPSFEVGRMFTI